MGEKDTQRRGSIGSAFLVLHGPRGVLDTRPIEAAFDALTGSDRKNPVPRPVLEHRPVEASARDEYERRRERALKVIASAVDAMFRALDEKATNLGDFDYWLQQAEALIPGDKTTARRRRDVVEGIATCRAIGNDAALTWLQLQLNQVDARFRALERATLTAAVGDASRAPADIAAELSLAVEAFGDWVREDEDEAQARERVAKRFEDAATR